MFPQGFVIRKFGSKNETYKDKVSRLKALFVNQRVFTYLWKFQIKNIKNKTFAKSDIFIENKQNVEIHKN